MAGIMLNDGTIIVNKVLAGSSVHVDESGKLAFLVSTADIDIDGDTIAQLPNDKGEGWKLDRFNKSPLILWSHDRWSPNMALPGTKAVPSAAGLMIQPAIFDLDDPQASFIEGKIRRGSLSEFSVGMRYIKSEKNSHGGLDVFEQELLEVSVVNRGANQNTAVLSKSMLLQYPEFSQQVSEKEEGASEIAIALAEYGERLKTLERIISKIGDKIDVDRLAAEGKIKQWDDSIVHVLGRIRGSI